MLFKTRDVIGAGANHNSLKKKKKKKKNFGEI